MFAKQRTPLDNAIKAIRPAIVPAAVFSFFINLLALVSPLYMLQVYDRVLGSRNYGTLLFLTLIAIFLFVVYGILESLRSRVLIRGGVRFENELRSPLFGSALTAVLRSKAGTSEAQPFRDADTVREFLTGQAILAFFDAPWVPLFIFACFLLHPLFGWLAIAAGLITFALAIINELTTKTGLSRANAAAMSAHKDAAATLQNAEVMQAMGMSPALQSRWAERRDDQLFWQALASGRAGVLFASTKSFRQTVQVLILGSGAYLALKGELSAGGIIAASILIGRALAPIELAVGQWRSVNGARGAWTRLQQLFQSVASEVQRMSLPPPQGALSLEQVYAAPPGIRKAFLKGISFELEKGKTLGVIGPSAAGKSTLVRVVLGVWPLASGTVRLDGFDVSHWDADELGPHIGYLPQDVELFAGTIAQNIARFRATDHEEIIRAARLAGVHEMVQQMPDGYDTQISEGGGTLSGGQRQRIGLARALFGSPALIVLDEPNANLDSVGESALIEAIRSLKQQRTTVIFVTHKTNMLSLADKVLVIDQGAVRLFGERDEVLAKIFGGPKVVASTAPHTSPLAAPAPVARG